MARISIVTSGHFCTNPRVWREADALSGAAHEVTVIGVNFDPVQADLDRKMLQTRLWRYRAGADIRGQTAASRMRREWYRLRSRIGRMHVRRGDPDPHALGYAVTCLLDAARDEAADLTIVHLEPAFWVGVQLLGDGHRVGADFEDWHSENSSRGTSPGRIGEFLATLERRLMESTMHRTTTSKALAKALGRRYAASEPEVIYNSVASPPFRPRARDDGLVRMVWFSQTLGSGRGLEDLFLALPMLRGNWRLELRANASAEATAWVRRLVPASLMERVQIAPTVPPGELSEFVARNDIGFALEVPACRNKDLTASNKIFEYLQSGLAVVASDTAGQKEVLEKVAGAGEIYTSGNPAELAMRLNRWLDAPAELAALRPRIHAEANACFAYEHQRPRLLASVERALSEGVRR